MRSLLCLNCINNIVYVLKEESGFLRTFLYEPLACAIFCFVFLTIILAMRTNTFCFMTPKEIFKQRWLWGPPASTIVPALFVEKTILFLLNYLGIFVKTLLTNFILFNCAVHLRGAYMPYNLQNQLLNFYQKSLGFHSIYRSF